MVRCPNCVPVPAVLASRRWIIEIFSGGSPGLTTGDTGDEVRSPRSASGARNKPILFWPHGNSVCEFAHLVCRNGSVMPASVRLPSVRGWGVPRTVKGG